MREYGLGTADVVLMKTYDVAATKLFGAFGAVVDSKGRVVLTMPGDRQLAVLASARAPRLRSPSDEREPSKDERVGTVWAERWGGGSVRLHRRHGNRVRPRGEGRARRRSERARGESDGVGRNVALHANFPVSHEDELAGRV